MANEYIDRAGLEYFWDKIKALPQMAVESGDGYCKMADGTLFCWGEIVTVVNFNTAWGGGYYGNVLANNNITFPTAFTAKPTVEITINSGAFAYVVGSSATASEITDIWLLRPTAVQSTMTVSWFAVGRWNNTTNRNGYLVMDVDNALSDTSENPVQNKIIDATFNKRGFIRCDTGTGGGDIKTITDYLRAQQVASGYGGATWLFGCRYEPTTASVFGTLSSLMVIGTFSSDNYGYGFILSDAPDNIAVWRRSGGPNSNYIHKLGFADYASGDYFSLPSRIFVSGHATSDRTQIQFSVPIPRDATGRTASVSIMKLNIRSVAGAYLLASGWTEGGVDVLNNSAYSVHVYNCGYFISFTLTKTSAFSVTNNTPVSVEINALRINFS